MPGFPEPCCIFWYLGASHDIQASHGFWSPRGPPTGNGIKTMRMQITDTALRGLKPRFGQRVDVWDSTVAGLCARCSGTGDVSCSVRARLQDGRRTRVSLGDWPDVSLKNARKAARAVLADVGRGHDPVGSKRATRAAA